MTNIYSFYPTTNGSTIRKVISHPDVKSFMFLQAPESILTFDQKKICDPKYTIYAMRVNYQMAGIALFDRIEDEALVDVAFLPNYRGKDAKILAKKVILDYIDSKGIRALKGKIRRNNMRSILFARWNNFKIVSSDEMYHYVRCEYHGRHKQSSQRRPAECLQ